MCSCIWMNEYAVWLNASRLLASNLVCVCVCVRERDLEGWGGGVV